MSQTSSSSSKIPSSHSPDFQNLQSASFQCLNQLFISKLQSTEAKLFPSMRKISLHPNSSHSFLKLHGARETGSLPRNDIMGHGKDKELVMEWLRNPSNEYRVTVLYRNISLPSIVSHGGMGKTTSI
ncbi:hypothetical protein MA16_Dca007775 [Dendrobium catenatum]|uniref:Uncharacterized protein n=1 Tax=Dendrobium catenatum TaxID=906689 RepID=A0A2I0X5E9_9ASPA|nr:hypothetical protein MA16_Dca007775 [Dendrobium catenatum]